MGLSVAGCPTFAQAELTWATGIANHHIEGSGIVYDAAGNVTNDGLHSYTYDAENRMTAVDGGSTASYVYDAEGRRVEATVGGETQIFLFDLQGRAITAIRPSDGMWIRGEVWSPVGHLATYRDGTTYFGTLRTRIGWARCGRARMCRGREWRRLQVCPSETP